MEEAKKITKSIWPTKKTSQGISRSLREKKRKNLTALCFFYEKYPIDYINGRLQIFQNRLHTMCIKKYLKMQGFGPNLDIYQSRHAFLLYLV